MSHLTCIPDVPADNAMREAFQYLLEHQPNPDLYLVVSARVHEVAAVLLAPGSAEPAVDPLRTTPTAQAAGPPASPPPPGRGFGRRGRFEQCFIQQSYIMKQQDGCAKPFPLSSKSRGPRCPRAISIARPSPHAAGELSTAALCPGSHTVR